MTTFPASSVFGLSPKRIAQSTRYFYHTHVANLYFVRDATEGDDGQFSNSNGGTASDFSSLHSKSRTTKPRLASKATRFPLARLFATGAGYTRKYLKTRSGSEKVCTKNQSLSNSPFWVIRGGGCGGSSHPNWLKSILWSFSG